MFDRPYETVVVKGSYGSLETTAYVEVVPKDILFFRRFERDQRSADAKPFGKQHLGL